MQGELCVVERSDEVKDIHQKIHTLEQYSQTLRMYIETVENLVKIVNEKIDTLYEMLKLEDKARQKMGEYRYRYCTYNVKGYCEEEGHVISDPKNLKVSTTQKNGKYYSKITWKECVRCDRYFFYK